MGLIVANLDCETAFAGAARAAEQQPRFAGAARAAKRHLPRPVLHRISGAGLLLAVFGRRGDALWTPLPVEADRLRVNTSVTLCTGMLDALPVPDPVLAWGETASVAALRRVEADVVSAESAVSVSADWLAQLWHIHPTEDRARQCNDRRFSYALGQQRDWLMPGTALVDSVEALIAHLAAGGARAGHCQTWVLKAPFSAAGRLRLRRRGSDLDEAARIRAERLFAGFGTLCFEPWVDRVVDFGCLGFITAPHRWLLFPPHRLETDAAGVFRGIVIAPQPTWLGQRWTRAVTEAADVVARALADTGYLGPFGIDGFVYRDNVGTHRLQAMCEINARLSFGFVAHAFARLYGTSALRLCLGNGPPPCGHTSATIVPLLWPGDMDDTSAWLELSDSVARHK